MNLSSMLPFNKMVQPGQDHSPSTIKRWILRCRGLYILLSHTDRRVLHSVKGQWPKACCKSKPSQGKEIGYSSNFNQIELLFSCWRQNWRQRDLETTGKMTKKMTVALYILTLMGLTQVRKMMWCDQIVVNHYRCAPS